MHAARGETVVGQRLGHHSSEYPGVYRGSLTYDRPSELTSTIVISHTLFPCPQAYDTPLIATTLYVSQSRLHRAVQTCSQDARQLRVWWRTIANRRTLGIHNCETRFRIRAPLESLRYARNSSTSPMLAGRPGDVRLSPRRECRTGDSCAPEWLASAKRHFSAQFSVILWKVHERGAKVDRPSIMSGHNNKASRSADLAAHRRAPAGARGAMEAAGDEERVLSPADAEDLLLRLAAEQEVSPLSMDAAFQPTPMLTNLGPRPVGGSGPARHGGLL